ncbi:MAG: ATP-binding protein [Mariprofundaceae bacterium]|nr:ATP-binding protein [Mariprofundaceae bacterium]
MHGYIDRIITAEIVKRLQSNPAVALLGARQAGKSTIAEVIIRQFPDAIYLDLERPADMNKLMDAEAFFQQFEDRMICLDEIQRMPDLFAVLRGVIDRRKRDGQFLLLGSASRELIRQSSESLAGRLSYVEITPFTRMETAEFDIGLHWLRGGYPRSLLAADQDISFQWREDYIRTFLERDIPQLGFRIPANTLGRFWRMLAHSHGQVLNALKLADSMGVSAHTIRKYIDLLEQTFVVRALSPWTGNTKKRLIKSPKVYIRDSGLLHALLDIETMQALFAHPVYGASFEGFVIENLLTRLPRWQASFYRTSNGAEIDLVLEKGMRTVAVEIKASTSPKLSRGNWSALEALQPDRSYVVAPVDEPYPLAENIMVTPLDSLLANCNRG